MCKTQDADQGPQRVQGSTIISSSIYFILDSVLGTKDTMASRLRHNPALRELTRQSTGAENPPQDHQEVDSMISQENGPKKRSQAGESLKQRHLTPPGAYGRHLWRFCAWAVIWMAGGQQHSDNGVGKAFQKGECHGQSSAEGVRDGWSLERVKRGLRSSREVQGGPDNAQPPAKIFDLYPKSTKKPLQDFQQGNCVRWQMTHAAVWRRHWKGASE